MEATDFLVEKVDYRVDVVVVEAPVAPCSHAVVHQKDRSRHRNPVVMFSRDSRAGMANVAKAEASDLSVKAMAAVRQGAVRAFVLQRAAVGWCADSGLGAASMLLMLVCFLANWALEMAGSLGSTWEGRLAGWDCAAVV